MISKASEPDRYREVSTDLLLTRIFNRGISETKRRQESVYAGLGEKDKAFQWLERDFQAKGELGVIRWQIPYGSLHEDPRFKDLLKRMGLPE